MRSASQGDKWALEFLKFMVITMQNCDEEVGL